MIKSGYSAVLANTADDGFSILKEFNPKLVVMDWALPRRKVFDFTNGVDFYKLIKSHPEFSALPVLILTGHPIDYIRLFYDDITIEDENYFEKPVNREKIIGRINILLNKFIQEKNLVILLESDPKVYNLMKQKLSPTNYTLKTFYNSRDFISFIDKNLFKKAVIILNQISAGVLDEDIYRLILEKIPDSDYSMIVFTNSDNYIFSENFKSISHDKTFSLTKKEFLQNPDMILNIIKIIK